MASTGLSLNNSWRIHGSDSWDAEERGQTLIESDDWIRQRFSMSQNIPFLRTHGQ
jgi:hypothetical protein